MGSQKFLPRCPCPIMEAEPDRAFGNFRHMAKESAKKAMEPYDWGVKAALHRMSEDSNPYASGTEEYIDWLAGFKDFADEDLLID